MPDIQGLDSSIAVETFLKRKDHQQSSDILRNRPYSTLAPCPHLRADKVHDRDVTSECLAGKPQVEVGKIHKDDHIRTSVAQTSDHMPIRHTDSGEPGSHLDQADHGQVAHMRVEVDTGLAHPVSSDSLYSQVRSAPSQLGYHDDGRATGSMVVPMPMFMVELAIQYIMIASVFSH